MKGINVPENKGKIEFFANALKSSQKARQETDQNNAFGKTLCKKNSKKQRF